MRDLPINMATAIIWLIICCVIERHLEGCLLYSRTQFHQLWTESHRGHGIVIPVVLEGTVRGRAINQASALIRANAKLVAIFLAVRKGNPLRQPSRPSVLCFRNGLGFAVKGDGR